MHLRVDAGSHRKEGEPGVLHAFAEWTLNLAIVYTDSISHVDFAVGLLGLLSR